MTVTVLRPITPCQQRALAALLVAPMKRPRGSWEWRAHDGKTFPLPVIAALRKRALVAVTGGEAWMTAALTEKGKGVATNAA